MGKVLSVVSRALPQAEVRRLASTVKGHSVLQGMLAGLADLPTRQLALVQLPGRTKFEQALEHARKQGLRPCDVSLVAAASLSDCCYLEPSFLLFPDVIMRTGTNESSPEEMITLLRLNRKTALSSYPHLIKGEKEASSREFPDQMIQRIGRQGEQQEIVIPIYWAFAMPE